MSIPGVIAYLIVAAVVATIIILIVLASVKARKNMSAWQPVGAYNLTWCGTGDDKALLSHVEKAVAAINHHTIWTESFTSRKINGWRIFVHDSPSWTDETGRHVAGLTRLENSTIEVGSDYAALAHEFVHVLEFYTEGEFDYNHTHWKSDGIPEALADYQNYCGTSSERVSEN